MIHSPAHPSVMKDVDEAIGLNNATYNDYYNRLKLLALSMFEWTGLPDSMSARYLERTLYTYGIAAFVYDDMLGHINTKCTKSNYLNIYEEALSYNCFAINYQKEYRLEDIVLVRNNLLEIPTDMTIQLFARRLYEAERTIDVNVKAQKTPVLIRSDEKQRLSLKQVYMNYDGNTPVIFGDKSLDISGVEVLKTDAPYVADKLQEYKRNVWCEALSFLGINNVADEKAERLVTNEVDANNQMIELSAQVMLNTRKKACEQFNAKYGTNIDVKLRTYEELKALFEGVDLEDDEEESDDNG